MVERARQILRDRGIAAFSEVNLDKLPADHPYQQLSSPSVLSDGKLLLGHRDGGGRKCTMINWELAAKSLSHG